ncbi:MAG TPA: hypothetical protein VF902_00370, partial [Coriobacteriia bacterium]
MAEGPTPDFSPMPLDGHDERHELLVASLLDRDLQDGDRAEAEGLLRACTSCAVLHADLAALAGATAELPASTRPRDFRLSVGDAARLELLRTAGGEPRGATSRLTGEMPVRSANHPSHDQLLIASLLDRSTGGADRERGEALIATCDDCASLHQDLIALRDAARVLPTPPRPRDFAISTENAARLRRTGWRRLVAAFGSTRDAVSRPLAIGLTTLGLAGLLVATIPGVLSVGGEATSAVPMVGQAVGGAGANSESLEGSKAALAPSAAPSAPAAAALVAPSAIPTNAPAPAEPAPAAPAPSSDSFDTFVGTPTASAGAAAIAPVPDGSVRREGLEATGSAS